MTADNPPEMRRDMARVVVAAMVHRERPSTIPWRREYLIMQRPFHAAFYPGVWVLPGGGIDLSDFDVDQDGKAPFLAALQRELAEECGTDLRISQPEFLCERAFVRSDGTPVVVLTYTAPWWRGDPELSMEAISFAWVTLQEAEQFDLIGSTLEEIAQADAHFTSIAKEDT